MSESGDSNLIKLESKKGICANTGDVARMDNPGCSSVGSTMPVGLNRYDYVPKWGDWQTIQTVNVDVM